MSNKQKEQVIQNAIQEYRMAKFQGIKNKIEFAINDLYNVYIMCAPFNNKGCEELRQLILKAES
jgi:hypothetical protein